MENTTINLLVGLATKVETAITTMAPKLWEIMLKQQYVEAISYCIGALICLILLIVGLKLNKKNGIISNITDFDERMPARMCSILGIILCLGLLITFSICAVGRLINPEYYAIKALIYLIM